MAAATAALFFGTLMPGGWKDAASRPFDSTVPLSMLAHIVLFAAICFCATPARFWAVRPWHVVTLGLILALVTEGLQFLAIDRHPNLAGIAQDMLGALLGWGLGLRYARVQ